eukprot:COSAG02_NODE_609_length_19574_cov_18.178537_14_plen_159_part_00
MLVHPQVLAERIIPLDSSMHNPDGTTTIVGFRGQALTAEEGSGTSGDQLSLPCDPNLLQAAQSAAAKLDASNDLPFWPGRDGPPVVHTGVVGSSDKWTQHRKSIEALHHEHQTLCEEMECQAIATVCSAYGIPFLGARFLRRSRTVYCGHVGTVADPA